MACKTPLIVRTAAFVLGGLALALALAPAPALGSHGGVWHTVERVSLSSAGAQGNDHSWGPALSADGRFVAFASYASNLVEGDTDGAPDVFVHDRQMGATERVSVSSAGVQANNHSFAPALSADARFVAFSSEASNLVEGDTNGAPDIFVHDRQTGATERASLSSAGVQANGYSYGAALGADGRFIAFWSSGSNLVEGDTTGTADVFVRDRLTGVTERVSLSSAGAEGNDVSWQPAVGAHGRFIAFTSYASNLVEGDTNGASDIFVHDRQTRATERVSVSSAGAQGNGYSGLPALGAEGRFVAFSSEASNLVEGDTNRFGDVFVHDRQTGATERVSLSSAGAGGNDHSWGPALSADGRFVAFTSYASNLVEGDTNGTPDIFVHDRQTGATERVSVSSAGAQRSGDSRWPALSADGRFVAFESYASNLVEGDTNGALDVFVAQPNSVPVVTAVGPDRVLYAHRVWTLRVARFTDSDTGESHTASIDWGDGTVTPGVVNEATGAITGSHRYLAPGAYTVTVTVTDSTGDVGQGSFQVVVLPHPRLRR